MDFNKCDRCGNFFITSGNICPNCKSKDEIDLLKLQNYIQDYTIPNNLEELSCNTGISIKNLNRHICNNSNLSKILKF